MVRKLSDKNKQNTKKTTPPKEEAVFTREDFLRDLRKAIRRLPKASHGKGKKRTSA